MRDGKDPVGTLMAWGQDGGEGNDRVPGCRFSGKQDPCPFRGLTFCQDHLPVQGVRTYTKHPCLDLQTLHRSAAHPVLPPTSAGKPQNEIRQGRTASVFCRDCL